jgi:carbamoyltransferase
MSRLIIGLNTDHGDSSAALVSEEGLVAAICEERLNRQKHSAAFPALAIQEVLRIAGADIRDITDIAVARDPQANAVHKAQFVARHPRSGLRMAVRRAMVHGRVRNTRQRVLDALGLPDHALRASFHQVEHHLAHVASAFYGSPFERCAALSYDGAGDFTSVMWASCQGNTITPLQRTFWPHSMGVVYTAITQFLGFEQYGEEYKVMGLAAYGTPRYGSLMEDLVRFHPREGLMLNLKYFQHHDSGNLLESIDDGAVSLPRLWGDALRERLGEPRRRGEEISQKHMDIAASLQARHEQVFLQLIDHLVEQTGMRDVVLAGGCALNSVANGRMLVEGHVDRAYFHPAASDDGTAAGAAWHVLHGIYNLPRKQVLDHGYLGTGWSDEEIEKALVANGRPFRKLSRQELIETACGALEESKIMGWFQGREEWGPRALGNRSILCNPSRPDMKEILNARIKNREPFRPFAPIVREEDLGEVFEGSHPVPFMIVVYKVRSQWRSRLPAITHEDHTGRVQSMTRNQNPLCYDLITAFKEKTGVPVLLNTSFNENEPIVHTPKHAIDCFERTQMDCLGIGSFWLQK